MRIDAQQFKIMMFQLIVALTHFSSTDGFSLLMWTVYLIHVSLISCTTVISLLSNMFEVIHVTSHEWSGMRHAS